MMCDQPQLSVPSIVQPPAPPRFLLFNGSPRREGHTAQLLNAARQTLDAAGVTDVQVCDLASATPDFAALAAAWQRADAILLGAPVYIFGPPAQCAGFFNYLRDHQPAGADATHALPKVVGLISQGGGEYSGAEISAQSLLQHVLAVGALPVSGYSPGASQGVIGQIADQAGPSPQMQAAVQRLALRVLDMQRLLATGRQKGPAAPRVLCVLAGEHHRPQVRKVLDAALAGAQMAGPVTIDAFDFSGQTIAPCLGCDHYCSVDLECVYHDGMQEFRRRWIQADAVLWAVAAEPGGGVPGLRAAIDRMNQVRFETYLGLRLTHMARHLHASGVLAVGSDLRHVASTQQFFDHCAMLYQDAPVWEPAGQGFCLDARDRLPAGATSRAQSLGRRVAQLASHLRAGLLAGDFPDEYYPSCERLGQPDRAHSRFGVSESLTMHG